MGTHLSDRGRQLSLVSTAILVVFGLFAAGCSGEPGSIDSPVSESEATAMAENALAAFNEADYAGWSRDWSDTMKSAIDEVAFQTFRTQFHAALGDYVSINEVTGAPGADSGTYRWTYDVQFAKDRYLVWFGFKEGSKQIEGVSFEEPSE